MTKISLCTPGAGVMVGQSCFLEMILFVVQMEKLTPRGLKQFFQGHTAEQDQSQLLDLCTWDVTGLAKKRPFTSFFSSQSLSCRETMGQPNKFCPGFLKNIHDLLGSSLQVIVSLCKTGPLFSTRSLALCYQRIFKRKAQLAICKSDSGYNSEKMRDDYPVSPNELRWPFQEFGLPSGLSIHYLSK